MRSETRSIAISVNGDQVPCRGDELLIDVLEASGRSVPAPCHGTGKVSSVRCGLCLVQVRGYPDPVESCGTRVTAGMEVITESADLIRRRKGRLESLFRAHYSKARCADCIWNGGCELHQLAADMQLAVDELARDG